MWSIVDQSCNIVFRHLWQLFLKDAFQTCQNDKTVHVTIIIDDTEFDLSLPLFNDRGLSNDISTCCSPILASTCIRDIPSRGTGQVSTVVSPPVPSVSTYFSTKLDIWTLLTSPSCWAAVSDSVGSNLTLFAWLMPSSGGGSSDAFRLISNDVHVSFYRPKSALEAK